METENKKKYELAYFLSPTIDEPEIPNYAEKVKKLVADGGLEVTLETQPSKRRISQPIKKSTFGYFGTLQFQGEPEKIEELKNSLKAETKLLRFMITVKHPVKARKERKKAPRPVSATMPYKPKKIEGLPPALPAGKTAPKTEPKAEKLEPEKEKIQLEELNKKLEEILKE